MSDSGSNPSPPSDSPPTLGSVLYKDSLPGLDQARLIQERGKAQTAAPTEAVPPQARSPLATALYGPAPQEGSAVESRTSVEGTRVQSTRPEAKPAEAKPFERSLIDNGDRTRQPASGTVPEGADPALWNEFSTTAKELNLDKASADRLVALHQRAIQSQYAAHDRTIAEWRKATEAAYSPAELNAVLTEFRSRVGDDADAREFKRMLNVSGLGSHPVAVRVIARLMRGR